MTAKILKLVLICLTLSAGGYAASEDVALITALTGTATATWVEPTADGNTTADENRRSHEWNLEVAEMLPVGAEITTGKESELTLIHLAGNIEYNIGASAQVKITEDRLEGQDIVSMPVKLVSSNLGLADSMQNQVGAVISDHVDSSSLKKSTFDSAARDEGLNLSIEAPPPLPESSKAFGVISRQPSASGRSESYEDKEMPTLREISQSDELIQEIVTVDACFALPREVFDMVYPADASLDVANYEINVLDEFGGWIDFNFKTQIVDKDFSLNIRGSKGTLPITLHVEAAAPSVVYAWRLEKSGLLAQAASIWLKLQDGGMTETKVAPHLKRIRAKLLHSQN